MTLQIIQGLLMNILLIKEYDEDTINFNAVETNENMNIDDVGVAD